MNLQPLYDVKARLEQAAIAGTALLSEDFRLKRAAEGLKPLAAASPVFAKLDAGLTKLLSAPAEARAGALLDTLALADAVAYTQAKTGGAGELAPLRAGCGSYQKISYGQISPLLTALTSTGGGRQETIKSTWENHPEFFADFRVLPAVVKGLGDSYNELAELNTRILKQTGPAALPLLKADFDPAGNKAMARRVEVIAALEGADATPWLREMLPLAKKDVRTAVLLALGNDPVNTPLLLELARTERSGGNREAVLTALGRLDTAEVQRFWAAETKKKPANAGYLRDNGADWASDLAAAAFQAILEPPLASMDQNIQLTQEDLYALNDCKGAILGRSTPAMLDCWRWIDSQLPLFAKLKRAPSVRHVDLGSGLPVWLLDSLCAGGPGPLCDLGRELWDRDQSSTRYLPHAVVAALLTRPAAEVYEEFSPHVRRAAKVRNAQTVRDIFEHLTVDQRAGTYLAVNGIHHAACGPRYTPLAGPLDRRWIDLMLELPEMEDLMLRLIPENDPELNRKLMIYRQRKMLERGHFTEEDVAFLRDRGWTEWKGFLDKKVRKDGSMTLFAVTRLLNATSLTGPEKAEELRGLYKLVQEQHAANKRPAWAEQSVKDQIAAWEAE